MRANDDFSFYTSLIVHPTFSEALRADSCTPLPDDWILVVADVASSTQALTRGAYKEVNLAGAAILAAAFDVLGHHDFPFVFAGDGASLALPGKLVGALRPAFESARALARDAYGLNLRIGCFEIASLRRGGGAVSVSRFRLSENFSLALFHGPGLAQAESLLKQPEQRESFRIALPVGPGLLKFDGLECRWEPIASKRGVVLSLIVGARRPDGAEANRVLGEFLEEVHRLLGSEAGHPVSVDAMKLGSGAMLDAEVKFRAPRPGPFRTMTRLRVAMETLVGKILMGRGVRTSEVDWSAYKPDAARNTDFRKFDGMLRMVLSVTRSEADALIDWLERESSLGRVAFGAHRSEAALMTCLIFNRAGGHLHLVDGNGGGYALAAQDLKLRSGSSMTRPGFATGANGTDRAR